MDIQRIPRYGNCGVTACLLIEKLKDGKPGDVLTDEELRAICEKNTTPGGNGYTSLMSAINYCIANHGVRWKRIAKANAIRVSDSEDLVVESGSDLQSIKRKARRSKQKIAIIDPSELDESSVQRLYARSAQVGAIEVFSQKATTKKLEVRNDGEVPSLNKVLELFEAK